MSCEGQRAFSMVFASFEGFFGLCKSTAVRTRRRKSVMWKWNHKEKQDIDKDIEELAQARPRTADGVSVGFLFYRLCAVFEAFSGAL